MPMVSCKNDKNNEMERFKPNTRLKGMAKTVKATVEPQIENE